VLAGATAAGIIPLVLAWIGDNVRYEQRQEVLARFLTASLGGMIVGQWGSGVLADTIGWRWTFALLLLLFLAVGLGLLLDPATRREPVAAPDARRTHLGGLGQVLAVPWARWILVATLVEGAFAFSVMAFLPAFLFHEYGLGISWAAAIVALYGLGGFVYSLAARPLLARFGEAGLAAGGGVLLATAWLLVALSGHWAWALPACVLGGLGYYMLHNTLTTLATQMVPALRGTSVSLFAASLFMGISVGVSIAAPVVDRVGYRLVFGSCGIGLLLLGLLFAQSLRRRARLPAVAAGQG
jgi:MFS transporter, YNFM family, putative membrane transport protein